VKKNRGFTLIEILVVIVIISIIITSALFSMHRFMQDRRVETMAKQIAAIIPVAQQQAMLQPAILGLKITASNYEFYRFVINEHNNTGNWQLITRDRILNKQILPAGLAINLTTHGQNLLTTQKQTTPQIIFFPSGDITGFEIKLGLKDQTANYALIGQENGSVVLHKLNIKD
jgi:general secretion pathway protein H